MPENWFNLTGVWNLIDGKLTATTNLRVVGAMEDPNRMTEYRDFGYDQNDHIINVNSKMPGSIVVTPSELVLDKIPANADLIVGMTYQANPHLRLRATMFNSLAGKSYYPDAPMPSLRLTDGEAADVTAYMMTQQKPKFLQTPIRPADPKAIRELAKGYVINTMTDRDAGFQSDPEPRRRGGQAPRQPFGLGLLSVSTHMSLMSSLRSFSASLACWVLFP